MESDNNISQEAIFYVKNNYKKIVDVFAKGILPEKNPISIFMAGSPGAGKTEISKRLIEVFGSNKIARIDPDDIRPFLPDYTGKNSHLFQAASSIGVEKIHDFALKNDISFILDGTFSNYEKSKENVGRSLNKGRPVFVLYAFQKPSTAWEFTQKREIVEGRNIPKEAFVKQFILARENVNKIKKEFKDKIGLWIIKRDLHTNQYESNFDIQNVDDFIRKEYNENDLKTL